jgi:TetR/AcrR family transcriptional regulator, repressor for neighboring sulfatase
MMNKGRQKKISTRGKADKTNAKGKIPYGREAVKKAILDATEKLLLKKSPNKITVREIAEAANIKHPLIYRHFGTKDAVIGSVHARSSGKIEDVVSKVENLEGNVGTIFNAIEKNKFRQTALTRAMIDGINLHDIPHQFLITRHLVELLKKRHAESETESKFDPEMMAAIFAATTLGWFLYEPFLLAATGLDKKNEGEIHQKVIKILEEILQKLC